MDTGWKIPAKPAVNTGYGGVLSRNINQQAIIIRALLDECKLFLQNDDNYPINPIRVGYLPGKQTLTTIVLFSGTALLLVVSFVFAFRVMAFSSTPEYTLHYGFRVVLAAPSYREILKLKHWMDEIVRVPKGRDTLWAISRSNHDLVIRHSSFAVISAGRTLAPMTKNLTNGVGEDVEIKFNARIPDAGSHIMFDSKRRPIGYTAVQNLYHELAHAMHKMTGEWLYFDSERSAIKEENEFRRDQAMMLGQPVNERIYVTGDPICPQSGRPFAREWSQDVVCSIN